MNLCPGDGYQTLTCSTAPTAPHKRSLKYTRIRLVFEGRTEGCRLRIHASSAARQASLVSDVGSPLKGSPLSVDHAPATSLASLSSLSKSLIKSRSLAMQAMLRLVLLRCHYRIMTVKSFPALPIQQSKTVTIALSVGYGSAKSHWI